MIHRYECVLDLATKRDAQQETKIDRKVGQTDAERRSFYVAQRAAFQSLISGRREGRLHFLNAASRVVI